MPRASEQRITAQPQLGQPAGRTVRATVAASSADNVPSYIPDMRDPTLDAFIGGLSKINPALEQWKQRDDQGQAVRGAVDRQSGKDAQESGNAYMASYFGTDGLVRGQQYGSDLVTRYNSEFDKDKGDLEGWLQETYQTSLKGVTDENYLQGFQKGITPAFQAIRGAHLEYQKKAVESRVESNAMQLIDNGVRAYVTQGQPLPSSYLESIQEHVGSNLGVSQQRFRELLFATVKKAGDEGHFDVYEVLKQPRSDGSPGMYYDPAWKSKIDDAELHSFSVSQTLARKSQEQRYNTQLYDVFLEEDPKKAQAMFREMKQSNLFKGDAEGLLKWEKLMTEKVDGKPDGTQLDNEVQMLAKIYEGRVSPADILNARGRASITASQGKYLLSEARRVTNERATLAASQGKADEAIYKTRDYADAKEFVEKMVAPRPKDPFTTTEAAIRELEFDRMNAAQAQREFFSGLKGKSQSEIQAHAEDIIKRYKTRQKDFSPTQQQAVTEQRVPFKSLQEVIAAGRKGALSPDEYRTYSNYFKQKDRNAR